MKYIPTDDAILACVEAWQRFFDLEKKHPLKLGNVERQIHCFNAGFHRGVEWLQKQITENLRHEFESKPDVEPFI